jgi:HK97 family phage portal protein
MNIIRKAAGWLAYKTVLRLSDPAEWYLRNGYHKLAESYGGDSRNGVGANVNVDRALRSTAVFTCLKIIGEDVGSLPLFLYRRGRGNSREIARDEPLYSVLHDAPNPETSAVTLRGSMTAHAALTGNGYARISRRRDGSDKAIGLYLMQPESVKMDRDSRKSRVFLHKDGNDAEKTYGVRDVLHLDAFGWDGSSGFDVVRQFRETIGLGLTAERYAANFFSHDATPSLVLKNPRAMSPEEVRLQKKAFIEAMGADGLAVTHSGIELEKIGVDPEKSQLVAQRIFQLLEVCRIFRMPPHKLAELTRATFSNIEEQNIDYYTGTLKPWLVRWEQAINRCCLDPVNEADLFAEHAIEGLLRGNFASQTAGFRTLLASGVYSINEVRALLNLNPVEGGDVHFIQINMGDIEAVAQGSAIQPPPDAATQPKGRQGIFRVRELA